MKPPKPLLREHLPVESNYYVDALVEQPSATEEIPFFEEPALTDTATPMKDTLPSDPIEPISSETEQTQQEQTIETIEPIGDGMVLQSTAYTYGPAALATLLKMIGVGDNYYQQLIEIAQTDQTGTSMLALRQAARKLGYQAAGHRIDIEELATSGPVVAHVVIDGYHHFTVVEGMTDGFVYMADPTLGRVALPIEQFVAIWSGAVLKVSGAKPQDVPVINQYPQPASISVEQQAHQSETLPEFANSLSDETSQTSNCATIFGNQNKPSSVTKEAAKKRVEPLPQAQPVPSGRLDEAGMHQIRGRGFSLLPLVIKATIKLAPVVPNKIVAGKITGYTSHGLHQAIGRDGGKRCISSSYC